MRDTFDVFVLSHRLVMTLGRKRVLIAVMLFNFLKKRETDVGVDSTDHALPYPPVGAQEGGAIPGGARGGGISPMGGSRGLGNCPVSSWYASRAAATN